MIKYGATIAALVTYTSAVTYNTSDPYATLDNVKSFAIDHYIDAIEKDVKGRYGYDAEGNKIRGRDKKRIPPPPPGGKGKGKGKQMRQQAKDKPKSPSSEKSKSKSKSKNKQRLRPGKTVYASCSIYNPADKESTVSGEINFVQEPGMATKVTGSLSGLSEGKHGIHVQQWGDVRGGCDSVGKLFLPVKKDRELFRQDKKAYMHTMSEIDEVHADVDGNATLD